MFNWNKSLCLKYLKNFSKNKYDIYLDSNLYHFDGDIIITDPYYICKEKESIGKYPIPADYISHDNEKDYSDVYEMTADEIKSLSLSEQMFIRLNIKSRYNSKQYHEERVNYDDAIKRYHQNNISDWALCNRGFEMQKLGISYFIIFTRTL